jgi:hypothetical protein
MAYQLPSTFTRYQLTLEETKNGQSLTTDNLYFIQNLICDAAEEKLSLKFDPSSPLQFAQREAELQGQIGILKMLVELASSSTITINSQE